MMISLMRTKKTCDYGTKYAVSFTLKGVETDFSVYVNGVKATKGEVTTDAGVASMPFSVGYTAQGDLDSENGVYIPGHLHIQILDASGALAYEKTYDVKMSSSQVVYEVDVNNKIEDVTKLEAGNPYFIRLNTTHYSNYYCFVYDETTSKLSWQTCTSDCKLIVDGVTNADSTVPAANVFYYHRDDTKIYDLGYNRQSAGAFYNPQAGRYLKNDFTFGSESEAVYVTCVNPTNNNSYVHFYQGETGDQLYYDPNASTYKWGYYAMAYPSKWEIYPVTVKSSN